MWWGVYKDKPSGYQDMGMHAMSTGKRDHEGRKNDGTIMRKLNKSSSITDVLKKGNVTSSSSHRPPLLDQFYPKFKKKKVNSRLVECLVHDKRDGEYDSEEALIFKRRKCTPEERQKECSSSTLTSDVEQIGDKDSRMKQKQSNIVVGSGTSGNDFNVIIKWKEWYAFEKEDDEASEEALINKRTERRRQEKMKHAKIRRGCNAEDSLDSKRCKGSGENVGKHDYEGKEKSGTIMKKLNKSSSVTDVLNKGNVTSVSSCQTPSLESIYPKFKKEKINLSLDECHVLDQKDSEEDSEEVLIFERRKCTCEENSKACSSFNTGIRFNK